MTITYPAEATFGSALVTGASGFIGTALVRKLSGLNIRTICLVRSRRRVATLEKLQGVEILEIPSPGRRELANALRGESADVVFNLASYGVRQEDRDPDQLIDGNIGLLLRLLEATSHWNVQRFIHCGSCSEYAPSTLQGAFIDETHPLQPTSIYGAAKAASGIIGNAFAMTSGIPFVTLRLFGVFGPHEGPYRLIPYLIHKLQNGQPVDLTLGEQVRDFLFEEDAAEAFVQAADAKGALKPYEYYNVCSSIPIKIRAIGETVAAALNQSGDLLRWGERAYRSDEPMWLVGDNRRFQNATAWKPTISMKDGISRMLAMNRKSFGE